MISPPKPVTETTTENLKSFDCGEKSLNDWLHTRAIKNEKNHASRTYIITEESKVLGYYTLATGSVEHTDTPNKLKRNMPDPIPVVILGRLAIDKNYQERGLGGALFKDAILRTINISRKIGIKAILVHALSENAKKFYLQYGFIVSPIDDMTLFLSIDNLKEHL